MWHNLRIFWWAPLALISEQAAEDALESALIGYEGRQQESRWRFTAAGLKQQGRMAKWAGGVRKYAGLYQGVGQLLYGIGSMKGQMGGGQGSSFSFGGKGGTK